MPGQAASRGSAPQRTVGCDERAVVMNSQSEINAIVDRAIRLKCEFKGGSEEGPRWRHVERELM